MNIDKEDFVDGLMPKVEWVRTTIRAPSFNLIRMAADTGISIAALYAFRRGQVKAPRLEIFYKMVTYLSPRVVVSGEPAPVAAFGGKDEKIDNE